MPFTLKPDPPFDLDSTIFSDGIGEPNVVLWKITGSLNCQSKLESFRKR